VVSRYPARVSEHAVEPVGASPALAAAERVRLERKALLLAWGGNLWHVVEFALSVAAGVAAGSIALVAFGIDSLIEAAAGFVIVWLYASPTHSRRRERQAQRLIAASYAILVAYVLFDAVSALLGEEKPETSWLGIAVLVAAAVSMPLLARAKRRVGHALGSHATASEGSQNLVCAYLAITALAGIGANALFGWWWADPVAALGIAAIAAWEGVEAWRGDLCDSC
jgi:divalent metal cation (Fe/Co/Zn/Cd) transporter